MALNDQVEADGALASCLLPVQPWIDVPDLSWKAVVTADGDRDFARRAGRSADGRGVARERDEFLAGARSPIDRGARRGARRSAAGRARGRRRRDERRRDRRLDGAPARSAPPRRSPRCCSRSGMRRLRARRTRGGRGRDASTIALGGGQSRRLQRADAAARRGSSGSSTARSSTRIRSTPATARRPGRLRCSRGPGGAAASSCTAGASA